MKRIAVFFMLLILLAGMVSCTHSEEYAKPVNISQRTDFSEEETALIESAFDYISKKLPSIREVPRECLVPQFAPVGLDMYVQFLYYLGDIHSGLTWSVKSGDNGFSDAELVRVFNAPEELMNYRITEKSLADAKTAAMNSLHEQLSLYEKNGSKLTIFEEDKFESFLWSIYKIGDSFILQTTVIAFYGNEVPSEIPQDSVTLIVSVPINLFHA